MTGDAVERGEERARTARRLGIHEIGAEIRRLRTDATVSVAERLLGLAAAEAALDRLLAAEVADETRRAA
jgi:hypothetical protein